MSKNELFTSLNRLCNEMDINYNTGCGGCCFVTACLAENLERNNISYKVIKLYYPTHYFIQVSDRYINRCDFTIRKDSFDVKSYNSKDLYNIYYSESWNEVYNKKWNLIVSTRIKALFNKYENSRT